MNLQPFVVTLCGLLIYRGVARYYTDDATAGFPFGASFPTLEWLTTGRFFGIPHSLIAFALITVIMGIVLHRSVLGRYFFAVGKNEEAARYSGIDTSAVVIASYVLCCGLTAVAAIFIATYNRSSRHRRTAISMSFMPSPRRCRRVFSARRRRGRYGVVLGTVLLQVLQNLVNLLGIPSSLNFAVMGSVILIGVLADQQLSRSRHPGRRRARLQLAAIASRIADIATFGFFERPGRSARELPRADDAEHDGECGNHHGGADMLAKQGSGQQEAEKGCSNCNWPMPAMPPSARPRYQKTKPISIENTET